jgi:inward rectifier potassium channel
LWRAPSSDVGNFVPDFVAANVTSFLEGTSIFALSWTLFHVIDTESPFHGQTAADLAESDANLVLNVSGLDDTLALSRHR